MEKYWPLAAMVLGLVQGQMPEGLMTDLNKLYYEGSQAYYDGKYMEGIDKLEKSLINWKIRQGIESACHIKCENPNVEATSFPTHKFNFENDPEGRYFVHVMERTVCYKNCVAEHPFGRVMRTPALSDLTLNEMENFHAYNYLQIMYHQGGWGNKAADAAWTYLQKHPGDEEMKANIEYYMWGYPEVDRRVKRKELKNLELPLYNQHFTLGAKAYDSKDYETCVVNMELAIKGFIKSKDDCDNLCYKMDNQRERFPQFWRNIADMEYKVIQCKNKCQDSIAPEQNNEKVEDPLSTFLSYLQFCYYQTGNLIEAANCVKTQQLMTPKDENVKQNMKFYSEKVAQSGRQDFQVRHRQDIVGFLMKKRQMEKLEYFGSQFLEYDDEGTPIPEDEEDTIEEMIENEIEKQLNSNKIINTVDNAVNNLKDEL